MLQYITRRFLYMALMLFVMTAVAFTLVQLPPGDFVTSSIAELEDSGEQVSIEVMESLRRQYGLDKPLIHQYFRWIGNMLRGDFGMSFELNRPVKVLIAERLPLTVVVSLSTIGFTYLLAVPIGIYTAVKQHGFADYAASFIGFLGLATPNFLLALILMLIFYQFFGISIGGLFSMEYQTAPWSFGKVIDLLKHLLVPAIVIGTAGTAGLVRTMRSCMLDELGKQYVETARAKGLEETKVIMRYPFRIAINPIVSSFAWLLPQLISGETVAALVLGLPTIGPLFLKSLMVQDTYLAGTIIVLMCLLVIVGTFLSDILLIIVDPRIKFEPNH